MAGLMARNILNGHFQAFFWGQGYGGLEPYFVAIVFAIFGQSALSLGLTPVILTAGAMQPGKRAHREAASAGRSGPPCRLSPP